ncbi:unnamed protein product [Adineta ricciae]|uniref:Uncharacterized protein n=1 Tax=Adineta ricciae TaxID=249248 RepID=A0A814X144_ADIRI|nr:unnamed protein product [Adineta ricciae]CAF1205293.1 unnamed protein product [Adineta ricciae]
MKRHSTTNELFLSPVIHHRKQRNLLEQEAFNQNQFLLSKYQRKQTHSLSSSSSYTSLDSYLKDFHLSREDFLQLRKALHTVFQYLRHNHLLEHRLTSPYLQNSEQSSFPLYTNEHFIRNGLLNHNDRPESRHTHFQSDSSLSSVAISPVNLTLPLTLLSNRQYLFNALTTNFISDTSRRSQSILTFHPKDNERESIVLRRNKVHVWKRDNLFEQSSSIVEEKRQVDGLEDHRTSSTSQTTSQETCSHNVEEEKNKNLAGMMITDDLFPMIKTLAPYIVIQDTNAKLFATKNITTRTNEKRNQPVNHRLTEKKKQSVCRSEGLRTKLFSLNDQSREKKRNYLLDEFASVLTHISKR